MELSAEDALRLNVLLANELQAVRIDESSMTVSALSDQGEAHVKLNPGGRHEPYVRKVKELISSHVLGSPGGYPVYLRRWTRMGQARGEDSLEQLLKLGEPEAVVAAVHAPGLTHELARRAWWALPESHNARCMLELDCVIGGEMGQVLAEFLLEFLPFETEAQAMIDSVRLMLQKPGLISDKAMEKLWGMGKRRNTYYVGFMAAMPDELPDQVAPHRQLVPATEQLESLADAGNPVAKQLLRVFSAPGQAYLKTAETVLQKPNNQDVVVSLFETLRGYFGDVRPAVSDPDQIDAILADVDGICGQAGGGDGCGCPDGLAEVLATAPDLADHVRAMLVLASLGERTVTPIFARTDAIGSVMRKKLEPVTSPIFKQMALLRGAGA